MVLGNFRIWMATMTCNMLQYHLEVTLDITNNWLDIAFFNTSTETSLYGGTGACGAFFNAASGWTHTIDVLFTAPPECTTSWVRIRLLPIN